MKEKNLLTQIKVLLGLVELEAMKLEDGETVVEAEAFEAGNEIFVVTADSKVALPEGSYILENGSNLEVDAGGVIVSVGEQAPEEAPAEAPAPEAEVEASTEAPAQTPKKIVESVTKETHLAEIKKLEDLLAEKDAKITELSAEPEAVEVKEEVELAETKALVHSAEKNTKKANQTFKINKSQNTKARVWDSLFN